MSRPRTSRRVRASTLLVLALAATAPVSTGLASVDPGDTAKTDVALAAHAAEGKRAVRCAVFVRHLPLPPETATAFVVWVQHHLVPLVAAFEVGFEPSGAMPEADRTRIVRMQRLLEADGTPARGPAAVALLIRGLAAEARRDLDAAASTTGFALRRGPAGATDASRLGVAAWNLFGSERCESFVTE